jgi:carboxylate-amine ligase
MDGKMIDFRAGAVVETREMLERVLAWTEPVRSELGIDVALPELNGAQRSRRALTEGRTIKEIFAAAVGETAATYPAGSARVGSVG